MVRAIRISRVSSATKEILLATAHGRSIFHAPAEDPKKIAQGLMLLRHSGMVREHQTTDAQLRIGESRDSGFALSRAPE